MKAFRAICVRDEKVVGVVTPGINGTSPEDGQEATVTFARGKEYTISAPRADGTVTVFTRYWLSVPADWFARVEPL